MPSACIKNWIILYIPGSNDHVRQKFISKWQKSNIFEGNRFISYSRINLIASNFQKQLLKLRKFLHHLAKKTPWLGWLIVFSLPNQKTSCIMLCYNGRISYCCLYLYFPLIAWPRANTEKHTFSAYILNFYRLGFKTENTLWHVYWPLGNSYDCCIKVIDVTLNTCPVSTKTTVDINHFVQITVLCWLGARDSAWN